MKRFFSSIRGRLVLSHVAAVLVGVIAVVVVAEPLTHRFFNSHVAGMGVTADMMDGASDSMMSELQTSLNDSFRSAIAVALVVSAVTAVAASIFAARRLADPIEQISKAARSLAQGNYSERVHVAGETELAVLARDVNTLAESLETTEQRRIKLINEIAHELRTPLSTIQGYMEGLLDGVFDPSDEVFGATAREASRLKRLASDLSSLSLIEEGAFDPHMEQVDLAGIASDTAVRLKPLFLEKSITLRVNVTEPFPVVGDEDRLSQVFTNVLGNAITYTDPGGAVSVAAEERGGNTIVAVTDTGKGIDPDDLERVFDRFHRVDPNLPGGTGVGLTVARSLVRRHNGELTAESDGPGTGSRFVVSIPSAP